MLAMALQMDTIIGHHTMKGIISIPHGVISQYNIPDQFLKRYTIYEGAVNNIPDEDSLKATKDIEEMVSQLKESDVLFVLISGIFINYQSLSSVQLISTLYLQEVDLHY